MTVQELLNQAQDRDLTKSYPKADGLYVHDYKIVDGNKLELIPSDTGKAGYKDKVSIQELLDYLSQETQNTDIQFELSQVQITGVEGITVARI